MPMKIHFTRFSHIALSNVFTAVVTSSSQELFPFAGDSSKGRLFTLRIISIFPFKKFSCNDTL